MDCFYLISGTTSDPETWKRPTIVANGVKPVIVGAIRRKPEMMQITKYFNTVKFYDKSRKIKVENNAKNSKFMKIIVIINDYNLTKQRNEKNFIVFLVTYSEIIKHLSNPP